VRLLVTGTERYLGRLPAQVLLEGGHDVVADGAISGRGSLSEIHTY
jgi:NAD(P)-dependent dehydrogenase (short-subunit alcohol dehydrogenase family)